MSVLTRCSRSTVQSCGALIPGERFRYFADQIICEACDERNPQSRRRLVS